MDFIKTNGVTGGDRPRIDGVAKVTGQARCGADQRVEHAAFAYLATARVARERTKGMTLTPEGRARVETGTNEIGTGVRTVLAQTVADRLGVPVENVEVGIGDSRLPASPGTVGANSTASLCPVVAQACEALREPVVKAAVKDKASPLHRQDPARVTLGEGCVRGGGGTTEATKVAGRRAGGGRDLPIRADKLLGSTFLD